MGMPVSFTMSQTGVRLSLLLSILTISKVFGGCEDYTCKYEDYIPGEPGKSITRIPVDYGVKCITVYNRPDKVGDCPRIRFDCEALNLRNRDPVPWRCNKGDKLIIYKHYDGDVYYPTRKYCRNRAPRRVISTNGLKMKLRIEKGTKGGQGGRGCQIKCIE